MATAVAKRLINVEEYNQMAEAGILKPNDRVELIHGELINMSPVGSEHAVIVNNLSRLLNIKFNQRYLVSVQNPVILNNHNEPEPDISILQLRKDFYSSGYPTVRDILMLIEVADSTLEYDQSVKKALYASSSITHYVIVNIVAQQLEIHANPVNNTYSNYDIKLKDDDFSIMGESFKVSDLIIS